MADKARHSDDDTSLSGDSPDSSKIDAHSPGLPVAESPTLGKFLGPEKVDERYRRHF